MCHTSEQLPCLVFFIEQVFSHFVQIFVQGRFHSSCCMITIVLKLSKMAVAPLWQDYFKYSFFSGHIVLFELGIWLLESARSHSGPCWVSRWGISLSDSSVGWKWGEGGWGSEPGKCLASLCSLPRWVESARLTSIFPICLFKNNQFYSHCLVRFPGEGNDYPLQYSCLEDPMNRGAWRAAVHGVAKSWTWLGD